MKDKLTRKRMRKDAEKKKERYEEVIQQTSSESSKKKDTIWKIIMGSKERQHATHYEKVVINKIEQMIDTKPSVAKSLA